MLNHSLFIFNCSEFLYNAIANIFIIIQFIRFILLEYSVWERPTMIAPKILILLGSLLGSSQVNPFSPNSDLFLNSGLGLGGGDFLPEDSVPAVGVREQLIRRHHYLQYVRTVYTRLKEEYRR